MNIQYLLLWKDVKDELDGCLGCENDKIDLDTELI